MWNDKKRAPQNYWQRPDVPVILPRKGNFHPRLDTQQTARGDVVSVNPRESSINSSHDKGEISLLPSDLPSIWQKNSDSARQTTLSFLISGAALRDSHSGAPQTRTGFYHRFSSDPLRERRFVDINVPPFPLGSHRGRKGPPFPSRRKRNKGNSFTFEEQRA